MVKGADRKAIARLVDDRPAQYLPRLRALLAGNPDYIFDTDTPPLHKYDEWLAEEEAGPPTEDKDVYDQRTEDERSYWGSVT